MRDLLLGMTLFFGVALIMSCNETQGNVQSQTSAQEQTEPQSTQVEEQQEKKPLEYKGFLCTGDNEFSPLTYTREYKQDGNNFITLYKISSPDNGYYLNITATHYQLQKKIIVSIDDITVSKEYGHISSQEITYEEPSLKMFGRPNIFRARGMDEQGRLPNDLSLRFASNKFENIKVVHIVKDDQMNSTKWYVLDEKN